MRERRAWVFDLDGTLTVAVHGFDAMRHRLGIEAGLPILDGLARMAPADRAHAEAVVEAWEVGLAEEARPAPGAVALLDALAADGCRIGVLTRNTRAVALRTLEVAGLADRVHADAVIGRHEAAPKPAPDGLHLLLRRFGLAPSRGVMVGDYVDDVRCGRAAGALALLVGRAVPTPWQAESDAVFEDLVALHAAWSA